MSRFNRPWYGALAAFLIYAAVALVLFANTWTAPVSRWIGLDGDPDSTIWSIQWVAYAVVHGLNPFVTNHIFYPTGVTVLWSNADAPVALGLAVLPITLWLGPIVAYNLLQTLALALSAWAAFIAIRPFVSRTPMAFVGALVYGFGPYVMSQAWGHMGLTFVVVPPLIFWLLHRLLTRPNSSPVLIGAAAGLLVALQLLVTAELVVSEAIVAAVGLVWLGAVALILRWQVPWPDITRRLAISGVAAFVVFAVLAAFPVYELLRGPGAITKSVRAFGSYVTDVLNLVIPTNGTHLIHTSWTDNLSRPFPGGVPEAGGYLGVVLIGVILFTTIRWWRDPVVLFAAGLVVITLVMSLGPVLVFGGHSFRAIHLPWRIFRDIPLANQVLPERLALYMDLFAGLILALFLDRRTPPSPLQGRVSGRGAVRSNVVSIIATAASLALLFPTVPWVSSAAHVPLLFQPGTEANHYFSSLVPNGSVAVILPADLLTPGTGYAMLWQATGEMAFKMPEGDLLHGDSNGLASNDPPPSPLWNAISDLQHGNQTASSDAELAEARAQLQDLHVRAIVVGPMPNEEAAVAYFTLLLGRPPVDVGGAHVWSTS